MRDTLIKVGTAPAQSCDWLNPFRSYVIDEHADRSVRVLKSVSRQHANRMKAQIRAEYHAADRAALTDRVSGVADDPGLPQGADHARPAAPAPAISSPVRPLPPVLTAEGLQTGRANVPDGQSALRAAPDHAGDRPPQNMEAAE